MPTVTPRVAGSGRPAGRGFGGAAPNIHFPARRPLAVTLRVPRTANPKIYYEAAAIAVSNGASPQGSEGGVCGHTATGSCGREREPPAHGRCRRRETERETPDSSRGDCWAPREAATLSPGRPPSNYLRQGESRAPSGQRRSRRRVRRANPAHSLLCFRLDAPGKATVYLSVELGHFRKGKLYGKDPGDQARSAKEERQKREKPTAETRATSSEARENPDEVRWVIVPRAESWIMHNRLRPGERLMLARRCRSPRPCLRTAVGRGLARLVTVAGSRAHTGVVRPWSLKPGARLFRSIKQFYSRRCLKLPRFSQINVPERTSVSD